MLMPMVLNVSTAIYIKGKLLYSNNQQVGLLY